MSSKRTIMEHIIEIKNILLPAFVIWLLTFFVLWFFREDILRIFLSLDKTGSINKQVINPTESFSVLFQIVSIFTSIFNVPIWIFLIWKYIQSELTFKEKKWFIIAITSILTLSTFGIIYTSFLLIPSIIEFFVSVTPSFIEINYSLSEYIDFTLFLLFMSALVFQLPLAIFISLVFNLTTKKNLILQRKKIYFSIVVVSALITPGDGITLAFVVAPLILLFELTIILAAILKIK